MKKCLVIILLLILLPIDLNAANKWQNLVEKSGKVLAEIQRVRGRGIPDDLMSKCLAIAVFPSTLPASKEITGKYSQGIIMIRDEKSGKWSIPVIFTMVGGSLEWQAGRPDIVLLAMNRKSIDNILQGQCVLGADDCKILSYSRTKDVFAVIKLKGAVITQHWDGNKELYGKSLSAKEILTGNKIMMPRCAGRLRQVLKKYKYKK